MTTSTATSKRRRKPTRGKRKSALRPTLGAFVCAWIERYCVHTQGDYFGKPFRLTKDQKKFIYRCYELHPDGSRVYRRVIRGRPKGSGKTELAAAIALVELVGPARCSGFDDKGRPVPQRVLSPDIPIGAASFEQADILFGAVRVMVTEGPLVDFLEVYDREILIKDGPGRMYRVAAIAGTNDGLRPTFFCADETHEWVMGKARVHLVISNGLRKRKDSWSLDITTAGVLDEGSVAEASYELGKKIESGEVRNGRVLFDWLEASEDWDLSDPKQLKAAVAEANIESFMHLDEIALAFSEMPLHEFLRYHLNRWVRSIQTWDVADRWGSLHKQRPVKKGERIALGFDGSYSGDSTGLVGCTVSDRHLFVVHHQEKPEAAPDSWRVDVDAAEQAIRDACKDYDVVAVFADPYRWQRSIDALRGEGFPVVDFPTNSPSRMVPATTQFTEAALAEHPDMSHDGDPSLHRHVSNAVLKVDRLGPRVVKEHKMSERRIDLAICAILAMDASIRNGAEAPQTELWILDL